MKGLMWAFCNNSNNVLYTYLSLCLIWLSQSEIVLYHFCIIKIIETSLQKGKTWPLRKLYKRLYYKYLYIAVQILYKCTVKDNQHQYYLHKIYVWIFLINIYLSKYSNVHTISKTVTSTLKFPIMQFSYAHK